MLDKKTAYTDWYERQKELGLCVRCTNPPMDGRVLCVACMEKKKARQRAQRDEKRAYDRARYMERKASSMCCHCGQPTDGIAVECEECREKQKTYQKANSERRIKYVKTRYEERKAQGLCVDCGKPAQANRVNCLACRDMHRMSSIQWARDNPYKAKARKYRYRALLENAIGHASAEQIEARATLFGHRCYECGEETDEVDHVIPLSLGGSNWPANLRPICRSCNASKGNRFTFRERRAFEYAGSR